MDAAAGQKSEVGDSEVKYVVDANHALSSNQGQIDMFEEHVAAYDTCVADEGDGSYIEVNANDDDDDINLYSDVESELMKVVGNQIDGTEASDDAPVIVRQSREQPAGKSAADKEEGELTPEPDTTGDFRPATAITAKDDFQTSSGGPAQDVSRVLLEEFNKRLAEIQAEAKRQSLALQKTFAEKLRVDAPVVLDDVKEREKPVTPVVELPQTTKKTCDDGSRARRKEKKPETSSNHRTSSRDRNRSADRKQRHRSAEDAKAPHRRREDDRSSEKRADEEFCVDCISEKMRDQVRRGRNSSGDSDRRRSRTRRDRRSESPRRRHSTDRRRSSRDRSRDYRRQSRDRSRDHRRRPSRHRSWDRRRSSRGRSRDRRRSSRDDPFRNNAEFGKKSRSLDRTDDRRSSPCRRRRFSGRDDDCTRLSRRDKFLQSEAEKSKAVNSGNERIEKRRMKTLVKRQMQIISDVIDNPNPKSGSNAPHHKESLEPDATRKKGKRKSSRDSEGRDDVAPEQSSDLNAMESFLEQLRDVRRKKSDKSEEADRLRRQRKLKVLQGAAREAASGNGPFQSRISIRRPADDDAYVGGRKLYFTSGTSRRHARDRRSHEKENVPRNDASRDVTAMRHDTVESKTDGQEKGKDGVPHEEKRTRSRKEPVDGDNEKVSSKLPDPPISTQKDTKDVSVVEEPHLKGRRKPSEKRDRIRQRSRESESSGGEDQTKKKKSNRIQSRKIRRLTTDPSSSRSGSDSALDDARKRSTEYKRNAALCEKRALRKKRKKTDDHGEFERSSSGSESDPTPMEVKKKMKTMKRSGSVSSYSKSERRRKPRRRHQLGESGSDTEDVKYRKKIKRRVSHSESDAETTTRRHLKRLLRPKTASESASDPETTRKHSKRFMKPKKVSESESEPEPTRKHPKRRARPKTITSESEPEKVLPRRKRKDLAESEGSDSDSYEILKKNLMSMCRKNGLDLNLLQLFLGDDDVDDEPKHAKRKQPKKNGSKTKTSSERSKTRKEISIPEERKCIESEEAEDPGPTLDELEMFLGKLRENRKETPEEEFHPTLEMQSLRRECAFLDRHRAKRKAKLMACVALTAKASAKEARFLEAMKRGKDDEHEIEKEKMIRKLKAGNDAIFSSSLNARTGERRPTKEPEAKTSGGNDDSEDSMHNKMFGISFAFKSPLKKSTPGGPDQPANTVDLLASEKAQAFLNSLRAKKKIKKGSQTMEDLPDKVNSA